MNYIKLFEGYYTDRINQVLEELKKHMKSDLSDWVTLFSDEISIEVSMSDVYMSDNEKICSVITFDCFKNKLTSEDLEIIWKNYLHMKLTLESDYDLSMIVTDKFGEEHSVRTSEKIKRDLFKSLESILDLQILISGK